MSTCPRAAARCSGDVPGAQLMWRDSGGISGSEFAVRAVRLALCCSSNCRGRDEGGEQMPRQQGMGAPHAPAVPV
eukprot:366226-Chlamydomonas_euryale.AAC.18